jgi:hypothetical protein
MDEVHEFCRRVLGAGANADQAVAEARATTTLGGRVELLAAAARACRARAGEDDGNAALVEAPGRRADATLSAAVAAELEAATAKLPERHREALALRELLRLSHDQVARVMAIDAAAVAPLLARARLRLRDERRASAPAPSRCDERDRALRSLARRQDSEPLTGDDDEWLLGHLGSCAECDQAHAAMLEASFCYRAWSVADRRAGANGAERDAPVAVSSLE